MGLFAFRRLREREAISQEVASFFIAEPTLIPEEATDGNRDSGNTKRRRRKLVHNAGGRAVDS
jgi:hypothetical protein